MKLLNYVIFYTFFIFLNCNQVNKSVGSGGKSNPNIIFILADDMGYGDPTCYNPESKIPTPNIDRIAENGIRLTDAYAHPWCVPSRYGLLTGKHPINSHLNWREQSLIMPDQVTIASLLKRNGYFTAMIGKWHLGFDNFDWDNIGSNCQMKGGPVDRGFDYFFGIHASLDLQPYFFIENNFCIQPPVNHIDESRSPGATRPVSGAFWREGHIAPDFNHDEVHPVFEEKAIELINNYHQNNKDQPFFLYLSLASPHTPWLPTSKFQGKSNAGLYGDFVMQVDNTVGRIQQALAELSLEENTLLIFASDNGPLWFIDDIEKFNHRSTGNLRGMKGDLWEGGHRIPFVAQWPARIPAGIVRNDIVSSEDILSTFAAIVGDKLPEQNELNSYNMLPVLLDKPFKDPIREELFIYNHAVRHGEWKYIEGNGEGRVSSLNNNYGSATNDTPPGELYNLKEDISEEKNLYYQYPSIVQQLSTKLKKNKEFKY